MKDLYAPFTSSELRYMADVYDAGTFTWSNSLACLAGQVMQLRAWGKVFSAELGAVYPSDVQAVIVASNHHYNQLCLWRRDPASILNFGAELRRLADALETTPAPSPPPRAVEPYWMEDLIASSKTQSLSSRMAELSGMTISLLTGVIFVATSIVLLMT